MSEAGTTWDGEAIAPEPPYGAAVIVYRHSGAATEFLLLHRAHNGPDYEGEWAWTPPSGARKPGETIDDCARRELLEEAGISAVVNRTDVGLEDWSLYSVEVDESVDVRLADPEHDRHEWVTLDVCRERCMPQRVAAGIIDVARHLGLGR